MTRTLSTDRALFLRPDWARDFSFVRADRDHLATFLEVREHALATSALFEGEKARLADEAAALLAGVSVLFAWWSVGRLRWFISAAASAGVPSVIQVGGFESVWLPDIGYGLLPGSEDAARCGQSLFGADLVLAPSETTRRDLRRSFRDSISVTLLPLGVDTTVFCPGPTKTNRVTTVGHITPATFARKGYDVFLRAAKLLPDVPFTLVGQLDEVIAARMEVPTNVLVTGRISDSRLAEILAETRVYVQASAHEAFGVALAESMAAACIPVVTRRGALPETAGPDAEYFDYDDARALVRAVRRALARDDGGRFRRRVQDRFGRARRQAGIRDLIGDVLRRSRDSVSRPAEQIMSRRVEVLVEDGTG